MNGTIRRRLLLAAALLAGLASVGPASASFPGTNGRIVFQSTRAGGPPELYSMRADATDIQRLTWNGVIDRLPRYSPDGSRIVFTRQVAPNDWNIWVMNADGSGERELTSGPGLDGEPVFTADGGRVVFQRTSTALFECPCALWIVGVDGSGERRLDTGTGNALLPDVSANGKVAFTSDRDGAAAIYVGTLRGGPVKRITAGPAAFGDFRPRWSPRGNDLVFMRDDGTNQNDVYRVHLDGTELRQLTSGPRFDEHAQWSPDGTRIVFSVFDGSGGARLHTIDAADGSDERVLPQLATPFVDTFDDSRDDTSVWHRLSQGTGVSLVETGGRAVISAAAGAIPFDGPGYRSVEGHYGSQCSFEGDYAISIDYDLLAWPLQNGFQASLASFFSDDFIWRQSRPWGEEYFAFADNVFGYVATADRSGSFRLVRSNGVLTASYLSNGVWIPLLTSTSSGTAVVGFQLADYTFFTGMATSVAFDNFRLESGELTCPGWWRDAAPDWAAG
jgi:TolB protein